jgi:hypothetical protein
MDTLYQVDILAPQFKANPFPFFARLRAEQPVWRTALPVHPHSGFSREIVRINSRSCGSI